MWCSYSGSGTLKRKRRRRWRLARCRRHRAAEAELASAKALQNARGVEAAETVLDDVAEFERRLLAVIRAEVPAQEKIRCASSLRRWLIFSPMTMPSVVYWKVSWQAGPYSLRCQGRSGCCSYE